jgi:hypothetical protein
MKKKPKEKKENTNDDFDSPWKEIIELFFQQFMEFFFPKAASEIDWKRKYSALDKEFSQITRKSEIGKRSADKLLKVWTKEGKEAWVLVHVEIQAQRDDNLPKRVYVYNYRIFDKFDRPVVSLAVLADDDPNWKPSEFSRELWDCKTNFTFPTAKLLDFKDKLEDSDNLFSTVTLAHLKTMETRKSYQSRSQWKARIMQSLYKSGFDKETVVKLYKFIDWLMFLPDEFNEIFYKDMETFEKEHKMEFVTYAERRGMQRGIQEGMQQGMQQGMQKGIQEGRLEMARAFKQKGVDIGIIADTSGIPIERVKML